MKKIFMLACLALTACGETDGPPDYLKIAGGGLTFNYRYSEASIVIVAKMLTPLPEGSTVEALFDQPGKKERLRTSWPALAGKLTYKLQSDPLHDIRKGEPLKVTLHVIDKAGKELDRDETQFTSDVDQSTLPSKPLVRPDVPNYVPQLENL